MSVAASPVVGISGTALAAVSRDGIGTRAASVVSTTATRHCTRVPGCPRRPYPVNYIANGSVKFLHGITLYTYM